MPDPEPDEQFMRRAIEIAQRGRGAVEPNPMVGCVIAKNGQVIGEGWHQKFGGGHAEVNALASLSESAEGATVFVSLEPCCHHGKTPPCSQALIDAGVSRVVAAVSDPFSEVAGNGFQQLRDAGIQVDVGMLESEGAELVAPYVKLVQQRKPWVIAKWAMTLDGKIATVGGNSQWISNEASREVVHQIRGRVDAVLVGIGTSLADDPQLNARPAGLRLAARVVLDSHAKLPINSKLVRSATDQPVILFVSDAADGNAANRLRDAGCEVLNIDPKRIDLVLAELGRRSMTNVLVEGGSKVLGDFLRNREIDEAHVFVGNRITGGDRITALAGAGFETIGESPQIANPIIESLGDNVYIRGRLRYE